MIKFKKGDLVKATKSVNMWNNVGRIGIKVKNLGYLKKDDIGIILQKENHEYYSCYFNQRKCFIIFWAIEKLND